MAGSLRRKFRTLAGLCSLALIVFSLPAAKACMTVRGPATTSEDFIQSEQAVIIWDEARHIEHFIRQVDIQTEDSDLGFIVPTPAPPELVEADARIFQLAADLGQPNLVPEVVSRTPLQIFGPALRGPSAVMMVPFVSLLTGMSDKTEGPEIVAEQDVAGYHAVTLAADNVAALTLWLKQNNYQWSSEGEDWIKPPSAPSTAGSRR